MFVVFVISGFVAILAMGWIGDMGKQSLMDFGMGYIAGAWLSVLALRITNHKSAP